MKLLTISSTRWFLAVLMFFISFYSCKKTVRILQEQKTLNQDYKQLKSEFFNAGSADLEVQKVAADIKKQDSLFKFLPDFVKKNGIPKWDKTLYKAQSKKDGNQSRNSARQNSDSSSESQGLFLIPLQSSSSPEIKSYITAYKHNDSLYSYRLYNRDSLNALQPDSNQTKSNLLNTQAVFGYFEKSINGKDSINVSGPESGILKNVNISFVSNNQGGRNSSSARQTDMTCTITMSIAITYEWRDFTLGDGAWIPVSVTVTVDISCVGGEGTSGGVGDPTGIGNYWWQYGTGWPWNSNNYSGFYVDPNAIWYPWWTSGGGYLPTIDFLDNALDLDFTQSIWLSQNLQKANQIYNYLSTTVEPDATLVALNHLDAMINSSTYLAFVENHALDGDASKVWWEDDPWVNNPNNFNLDINSDNSPHYELTSAEKILRNSHPVAAALIFLNIPIAKDATRNKMGVNGLNDKSDAFRHSFFHAINARDALIGPTLTQQFSDAHETEVPLPQLSLEKQMDLFNNSVGISYGQSVGFFTSYITMANEILNKINNGELKYLKPIDFTASPRYDDNGDKIQDCSSCLNGILDTTELKNTNQ